MRFLIRSSQRLVAGRYAVNTTSRVFTRGALIGSRSYSSQIPSSSPLEPLDTYLRRHNGSSSPKSIETLLDKVGYKSVDSFVESVVPDGILSRRPLQISPENGLSESQLTSRLREIASENKLYRSFIGRGYYGTIVPPVIQRNILECPEWYTSYTPYQPEIAQGRLESLMNFQTLVADLTGMSVANASLLDEATAGAEAMAMGFHALRGKRKVYYVDENVHSQTISVLKTRAKTLGIEVVIGLPKDEAEFKSSFGTLIQYPGANGNIESPEYYQQLSDKVHGSGGVLAVATDLLALTVLKAPSSFGADIVFGNSQRFGVPFGYGGPHAAFFAVADSEKRKMPGRLIGRSKDRLGNPAFRLALQTREQHIRREKATSNICTAQALLANMAAMYAVYHGPEGLKNIANRVYSLTTYLASQIESSSSHSLVNNKWFDTLTVKLGGVTADEFLAKARSEYQINLFKVDDSSVSVALDETVTAKDVSDLVSLFTGSTVGLTTLSAADVQYTSVPEDLARTGKILQFAVFNTHHSETELLRYIHHLQSKDLSLANSMIPLGSCTMKLNATVQMAPVTWPEFGQIHPFAPIDQAKGYQTLVSELEADLADITGFDATSLQPNSGAQGEFAGLKVIRAYLDSIGQGHRDICIIPVSAHGTNPASAAMAGFKVVSVKCTNNGELDLVDLEAKAEKYKDKLAATMITYPSTYGVFEPGVKRAIEIVHSHGGQVYMDGANMNAQIGLTSPGEIGADVCHLNLHKTFCIPHGGGGPGVGPICVKSHLQPFLPSHDTVAVTSASSDGRAVDSVSAAPYGSASILPISWAYIKLMGASGLKKATELALLNANYMKARVGEHFPVAYTNAEGRCAHEFIVDLRGFKSTSGIEAIDVAKRLQDYGFHAPTMSWPVPNTLMIEPTESESIAELDRFCDALISIRKEIADIEEGRVPRENNVLKNAPHSQQDLLTSEWDRPYTREQAAYPLPYLREAKFWPSVTRLDDNYGDLNLFCSCDPVEAIE
ncbi:glycine decarboxylase subunit P [Sugiyamaella lignohabitans]|uniref:Glycine cleavage system P protein n=1 Tax=Sugiyamaella lignohabitans TaxID=796027 RepID=A0A167C0F7_9ASCO|nr:glycine decarboxylase subunit P [Sugiyamaella lignohabitans]ANB11062.1 glycine decarboxylase subunit P [Sugiyamaella lignohabitans]